MIVSPVIYVVENDNRAIVALEATCLAEAHGDFTLTFLVDLDGSPTDSGRPVEPGAFPPQRG